MKKLLSCVLIAVFCLTLISPALADEGRAQVSLEIEQVDEQGFFTASLIIRNATFNGVQAALTYNKDVAVPISFEDSSETEDFYQMREIGSYATAEGSTRKIQWLTEFGNAIKPIDGVLKFALFVDPTQNYPNSIINSEKNAVVGEDGVCIYNFRFKKIADGNIDFKLLTDKGNPYFDEDISNGFNLALAGGFVPMDFNVVVPDELGRVESPVSIDDSGKPSPTPDTSGPSTGIVITRPTSSPTPEASIDPNATPTVEQLRKARVKDTIALNIGNYATVVGGALRWIDSNNKLVIPYIKDARTYVPIRFISETMGAEVLWDEGTSKVTIKLNDQEIIMIVGKADYKVNGENYQMDVAPEIVEARTFVPIRFIAEALKKDVYWNEGMSMVIIAPIEKPWKESETIENSLISDILLLMMPGVRDMQSK